MTERKYTAGKWAVSSSILVCSSDAKLLANCAPALGTDLGVDMEEAAANARLMAAAPELLDALKGAEEWLSGWASAEPYLSVIRAAISKATGATP